MEASMRLTDRIGRRLKLRDLHILLTVAERGSMAKAADELAISQPVVSKTIAELERAVGVRLLDRSRQGVEPTLYGRVLIRRGLTAFDELREGIKEIDFLNEPTAGEVRVGALGAMIAGLVPAVISRMRSKYPRLTVHVMQMFTAPAVHDNLRQRRVDFIIGRLLSGPMDKDLDAEILFDEPVFVVAGASTRWAKRRKIAMTELIDQPWVLPQADTEVGLIVAEAFRASGLALPKPAVVCSSIEMYWSLLATSQFLAIMPLSLLRFGAQRASVKALPVRLSVEPRPVGIVTLKNRTLSPAAQLLISCIHDTAKPLANK
jgi:DNA-binding transcriptional LysR family regulator